MVVSAEDAASKNPKTKVVICPPFTWLTDFSHKPHGRLFFGAQTCGPETKSGPYTGEISSSMLKNSGVKYVILGHSERRAMGETDKLVAQKLRAAVKANLCPILCVGESLGVRKKGRSAVFAWLKKQLHDSTQGIDKSKKLVIAYEPIWAISTNEGLACKPEEAKEMVRFCKSYMANEKIFSECVGVYGGSVDFRDAVQYLLCESIDGLLIGHDGLNPKHFQKVVSLAESLD